MKKICLFLAVVMLIMNLTSCGKDLTKKSTENTTAINLRKGTDIINVVKVIDPNKEELVSFRYMALYKAQTKGKTVYIFDYYYNDIGFNEVVKDFPVTVEFEGERSWITYYTYTETGSFPQYFDDKKSALNTVQSHTINVPSNCVFIYYASK